MSGSRAGGRMGKRTRPVASRDTDSDYAEESDASYRLLPGKKKTTRPGSGRKRAKTKPLTHDSELTEVSQDDTELPQTHSNPTAPHIASRHEITNPTPLREALLSWYAGVHESRGMPWRKPYDPTLKREQRAQRAYEVWISEIMLQQTQVVTVIPYYNKWMTRFPTIRDLAASDIEAVNALWKGLGYYSRAARLLSAAKKVVAELGGHLPDNAKDMQAKIPGIGRYSAGAICSIAYNERVPVLDGNVNRLLSRVLALHANPKQKTTLDVLWAGAEVMVDESDRAGDVNQALIELGATVCKVRDPGCKQCPLQAWCKAYQLQQASDHDKTPSISENFITDADVPDIEELCTLCEPLPLKRSVTAFPMKVERKKAREELDIVNVVEWRHRLDGQQYRWFLLVRRPEGGMLAGLHEFPTLPDVSKTLSASAMQDAPHHLLSDILATSPLPYIRTTKRRAAPAATDAETEAAATPAERSSASALRIVSIRTAGDVIHVFSHIKKTYRVQWVVLEGGEGPDPPSLAPRQHVIGGGKRGGAATSITSTTAESAGVNKRRKTQTQKTVSAKRNRTGANSDGIDNDGGGGGGNSIPGEEPVQAIWLLITDVPNANIGTGVLKVWKQVSTLWDGETDTDTATDD